MAILRLWTAVLAIFLVLLPAGMVKAAEPSVEKVAEGVYAFIGADGATNSGFVVTDEGVVVIDTQGPKELAMLLKEKIKEVTDKPVIYVINTHYHGDHSFGNQHFREARAIISHDETRRELAEKDKAHRARFKRFFGEESLLGFNPTLPDMTFSDTLTLRAGGREFHLVYAGIAHTYGDIYVYLPREGVVFAGDILYKGRLPWLDDGDSGGALNAVTELLRIGAGIFVPGHGGVAKKGDVQTYRKYLETLRAEVERLIGEGKSMEEVKAEIKLPEYSGYLMYENWLGDNAVKVYRDLTDGNDGGGAYE